MVLEEIKNNLIGPTESFFEYHFLLCQFGATTITRKLSIMILWRKQRRNWAENTNQVELMPWGNQSTHYEGLMVPGPGDKFIHFYVDLDTRGWRKWPDSNAGLICLSYVARMLSCNSLECNWMYGTGLDVATLKSKTLMQPGRK